MAAPELLIVDPRGQRHRLRLEHNQYVIGRDPSAPISLQDPQVSRRHARNFRKRQGFWI